MQGFLLSCTQGREWQAGREMVNVLEEVGASNETSPDTPCKQLKRFPVTIRLFQMMFLNQVLELQTLNLVVIVASLWLRICLLKSAASRDRIWTV